MGLGKTRQTVTFLLGLLSSDIIHMALIISPVSILDSWVKELGKVGLDDISYIYQTSDGSLDTVLEKGGILLTNYEMYTKQSRTLGSPDNKWDYVVLDEAHRIKNMDAHVTRTICNIHCRKTNLVTGTPFARNIEDVYALINFIRPNILGNKAMFKKNYISTVDLGQYSNSREDHKEKYLKALARCRNIISPYILRRNKTVLIENGDLVSKKTEVIVWLKLTDTQIKLYKLYGSEAGFRPQDANSFPLTTLSRLISIDPHLLLKTRDEGKNNVVGAMAENLLRSIGIDDAKYQDIQISCKISFVMDLIENILSEDREEEENERNRGEENGKRMKILVFSQHMHVLDIIEEYLGTNMEGFNLFRIDGSVLKPRRDAKIEEFNKEEGPTIFLLSARVGAEGLNLVAATRVIIVDPAWNLSDDNQISDRVYRIGQTKDVVIYRLFTCGTIEDHMFKLQLIKGITAHALIEGKICDPLVRKEDGNVFVLPKTFDYSKICNSLRREFGDTVDLDRKHQTFLRTHHLVKGIADHKLVFSKAKNLADVPLSDSSSEEEISAQKQKCSKSAMEKEKLPKSVVPWNSRLRKQCSLEQATSKQEDAEPILVQEMMEIPADKVRMLLANGAERLRQIQRQSCATIRAEIQKDPRHVAHGVVKLTGTQKEIEIAQQLVNAMITSADQAKDLSPVKIILVPIPTYMIGRIIGKHGNNVKSMIEKSGADIKVLGTESKCKLTGSSESIESAQQLIKDMISNTERTKDMSPVKTVVVPIPTDMVGRIIGKDGERVKSMIKKSGANIQVLDTESKCKLTGSSESIECARSLISDVIEKAQKVVHSPWPTFRGSRVLPPPLSHSPIVRPLLPWQPGGDFQPPVIRAPCHFSQDPTQPMRPRHPWQPNFDARPAQYVRPPEYGAPPRPCGDQGPPPE